MHTDGSVPPKQLPKLSVSVRATCRAATVAGHFFFTLTESCNAASQKCTPPGSQPMGRVNLLCTTTLFALVVDCVRVGVCAFHAPAAGSLHKASYREPAIHERESSFVCSRTYTCGGVLIYLVHAQSEGHELLHCKSHGRLRAERIKYPLLCNMNDCRSCRQETQNKYLCSGPMRVHVYGNMSPFLEAVQYHWPAEATTEHIESQVNDGRTANPS